MELPWDKLDVVTYSWQKVLGGEGAHGMLILSPRAVARLESYSPPWPLPKIFRMKSGGKLHDGIFKGETINTPSMLCVADYLDALEWAEERGRREGADRRAANANLAVIERFVAGQPVDQLSRARTRHPLQHQRVPDVSTRASRRSKQMVKLLEAERVAIDIGSYKDAPPGSAHLVRRHGRDVRPRGADALAAPGLSRQEVRTA